MTKLYKSAIYLFNRDLRVQDNELLTQAIAASEIVYPIFIFTPEQVDRNKYMNHRAIHFMCESLRELATTIPICFFHGDTCSTLKRLIKQHKIDAIYNNIDVTPYAVKRERQIDVLCKRVRVAYIRGHDIFFGRNCKLTKADGRPYLKFTPFYNNAVRQVAKEISARTPSLAILKKIASQNLTLLDKYKGPRIGDPEVFTPGRSAASRALAKFARSETSYLATRDIPAKNSTSHLSAYLHYGVLGPIEVAEALKSNKNHKEIVRQLLWREFYMYIIWMQHTDYTKRSRSIVANNRIKWRTAPSDYKKWCAGKTGCPIVDAGMAELNATGYMQNRLRMIVAMYLVFHLRIDWRLGEMYFAQNLVDYDYCNNLGGWMWSAGWEVHSNEYYRAFSMSSQMKRFDPAAEYVKKWLPELRDVSARDLYDWSASHNKYPAIKYAKPLLADMDAARAAGIAAYKTAHGK